MMSVAFDVEPSVRFGIPQLLFELKDYALDVIRNFDISPDGERFLMVKPIEGQTKPRAVVVLNWFDELERLLPTQ